MKKSVFFTLVLVLSLVFSILFVSCPNQSIGGGIERDSRNNTSIYIKGTINEPLTDSRKFTVTLSNATFRSYSRGDDVSSWFVDENGEPFTIDGLHYRIANPVARGSNKASIRITGKPTIASKDQIHLLIPCDTFQGPIKINVDTEEALFYNIIDYVPPTLVLQEGKDNDMIVSGMETKWFTKEIKFKLEHGYFATDTSSFDLEIMKAENNGDGSIMNTKTGGIYLDQSGSGEALDYKWSAITLPSDEDADPVTEITLTISGTPQKQRSGETFKVTLKSKYYGTIIDDKGEEYTDDLKVSTTGEYNFTEVLPTLTLVESSSSTVALENAKITGNADESLDFTTQYLYFRIDDGKLNFSTPITLANTDTEIAYSKAVGDATKTTVKRADFFTGDYQGAGLKYVISPGSSSSSSSGVSQTFTVTVSHDKVMDGNGEKLSVYKNEHNFTIPANLIVKSINNTDTVYDKAVTASAIIAFNIEEPKPVVDATKANDHSGVFFTGVVLSPISTSVATGEQDKTTENGGVVSLVNPTSFRFKEKLATGNEVEIKPDNKDIIIEPRYDEFMTYYYKILPSSEDSTLSSVKLYVKNNPQEKDTDGEYKSPNTENITYEKSSTGTDTATYAPGTFDDKKKDKYEVKVTFSKDLFEQFKANDVQTFADGDQQGTWVDYSGSDVVIAPESHLIRYRIMKKDIIIAKMSDKANRFVEYTNESGDKYIVDYTNRGVFSYAVDVGHELGEQNEKANISWALIPGAIPTSSVGKLVNITSASTGIFDRLYGKFNTPVNYNMLKYIDANPSTVNPSDQYSIKDVLYGMDTNQDAKTSGSTEIPNSGFNRFTLVATMPEGYNLVSDGITSDDVRIFGAKKVLEEVESRWDETQYGSKEYSDDEIKIINNNLKLMIATDDGKLTDGESNVGKSKPLYIYLDSLTDENNVLTNALFREDIKSGNSKQYAQIYYPDIRINPSKLVDTINNPYISKSKAVATKVESDTYDGDVSKLKNADLWIPVEGVNLSIYITPTSGKGITGNVEVDLAPLSWQYRIMDRADYTYVTSMFVPNEKSKVEGSDHWSLYGVYRHTPQTLSVNADMTTGVQKSTGAALTKDYNGTSHKYLDTKLNNTTLKLVVKADVSADSGSKNDYYREFNIDGESIPIREIKNGTFTQTVYNQNNVPTIKASELLDIVQNAKRKGYRPAGFSRGVNYRFDESISNKYFASSYKSRSVYSDLLPYKGVDDFGNLVDWSISYDDSGNLKTDSGILNDGIKLQLSDARGYRNYVDSERSKGTGKEYLTDWYNTTYIYLVWEKDPNSVYYNKENSGVKSITTGTGKAEENSMKFVRIPGDLNWLGFRNPKDSSGYYVSLTSQSDVSNDLATEYSYFDKISDNDFAIADMEMNGELFKKVYDWAIQNGYSFSNNSTEVYYPVQKNPFDYTINSNNSDIFTVETSSFDVSKIYGGKRPHTDAKRGKKTTLSGNNYWSASTIEYTNVDGNDNTHPVTNVNIYDAMLFCNALTEWYNKEFTQNLVPAYSSSASASGVKRTYKDIKDYMGSPVKASQITESQSMNGFRLPSYNEWFAAATIVPEVNNFLANAALDDSETATNSSSNYYLKRRGIVTTSGVAESNSGSYERFSEAGYQSFDTSYPFMQNLKSQSGMTEEFAYLEGIAYEETTNTGYAKFAHTNKNFTKAPMLESTLPVKSLESNALGLYDMSGNVSEWTLGTAGNSSFFALAGGDFAGSEEGSIVSNVSAGSVPMISAPASLGLSTNKTLTNKYGGYDRIYTNGFYTFGTYNAKAYSDTRAEGNFASTGTPMGKVNNLNINQRSRNVGFRVCRTVLADE